jgi:hypothetical protein
MRGTTYTVNMSIGCTIRHLIQPVMADYPLTYALYSILHALLPVTNITR